ncbi:hypothetical protein PWT90_06524 [Aphanocladium album]|nr:hypothetical protein PWT90_06524 [Aphanocladium album]
MKTALISLALAPLSLAASLAPVHEAGLARAPTPRGNFWWHTCGFVPPYNIKSSKTNRIPPRRNCKCGHSGSKEGFTGDSGCIRIDHSIRALGLTRSGTKQTTCSIFTSGDCSGSVAQSVGVGGGSYACTALNQNSGSIRCYFNV